LNTTTTTKGQDGYPFHTSAPTRSWSAREKEEKQREEVAQEAAVPDCPFTLCTRMSSEDIMQAIFVSETRSFCKTLFCLFYISFIFNIPVWQYYMPEIPEGGG
jgi:hypothetical protein